MDHLLEKRELRDLKILRLLYSNERWWSAEELAQLVDCSVDSANKSVGSLMDMSVDLEDAFKIISQKNKGIILHASSNYSISKLESLYYQNTFSYQIVDKIFQSPDFSIEKLTDELFLSKSTLYRKLKPLDYIFEKNHLELDKNSLTLSGSEVDLREFFYVFYWSISRSGDWPFKAVNKDLLEHRLEALVRHTGLELSHIEEMQLYYRMAINFTQHQKKQFVTALPTAVVLDPYRLAFLDEIARTLTSTIPQEYRENEYQYLGLIFSTYPYTAEAPDDDSLLPIVTWYQEQNSLTYQVTEKLISTLINLYPEHKLASRLRQPKLLFALYTTANYALLFPHLYVHTELTSSWQAQLARYQTLTPTFFSQLKKAIYQIQESSQFKGKLIDPFFSLFTIYSILQQNIELSVLENTLTIKLICGSDSLNEASLSEQLQSKANQHLIISTSKTRDDHATTYDLLLADIQLAGNQKIKANHHYVWDYPPSDRDWNNLLALLPTIIEEKRVDLQNDT